jgi:hypothetical protein
MAIEFSCRCGARFRVEDEVAGKRARCKVCRQYVIIPAESTAVAAKQAATVAASSSRHQTPPPLPSVNLPPPAPVDPWMERQIEQHQKLTQSAASSPGRLRISHLKHWLSFPLWPTLWLGLLLLAIMAGILIHWAILFLAVPFAGLFWLYWWIQRAKFISGCTNPAMVVSLDPPLVAVLTDLALSPAGTRWHYIKVLEQPLNSMTGELARVGQRLAAVATYRKGDSKEHWNDFSPVVVNCVSRSVGDIARVFGTLTSGDWQDFDKAIRQVPQPISAGLYKVELQIPAHRQLLPVSEWVRLIGDYLPHGADNRCWISTRGIPPYLLQSAVAAMAKGAASGEPLALVLANGDKLASTGLLLTTTGGYFQLASGLQGAFRWSELAGAGNATDGLEVVLTSGARFRWGEEFGKFSNALEAVLDGIAKAM